MRCHQRHLLVEIVQILNRAAMILGDDLVACTEVAKRFAERQMHVDRQRWIGDIFCALSQIGQIRLFVERGIEAVGRRVRRVARAECVELADQFFGEFDIWRWKSHWVVRGLVFRCILPQIGAFHTTGPIVPSSGTLVDHPRAPRSDHGFSGCDQRRIVGVLEQNALDAVLPERREFAGLLRGCDAGQDFFQ